MSINTEKITTVEEKAEEILKLAGSRSGAVAAVNLLIAYGNLTKNPSKLCAPEQNHKEYWLNVRTEIGRIHSRKVENYHSECIIDNQVRQYKQAVLVPKHLWTSEPSDICPDFNYMGIGVIYSIGGVRQPKSDIAFHFFN